MALPLAILFALLLARSAQGQLSAVTDVAHGVGSALYSGATTYGRNFGEGYEAKRYSSWTEEEKIADIIKHMCFQNALTGAGAGVVGLAGVPAGLASSIGLQVGVLISNCNEACSSAGRYVPARYTPMQSKELLFEKTWVSVSCPAVHIVGGEGKQHLPIGKEKRHQLFTAVTPSSHAHLRRSPWLLP